MMMTFDVNCKLFSPEVLVDSSNLSLNLDIPIAANRGAIETKKKKEKTKTELHSRLMSRLVMTRVFLVTQKCESWSLIDSDVP